MTTMTMDAAEVIKDWPEESREAAQLVIDEFGEPHEITPTHLHWSDVGEWKRVIAQREFFPHEFPAPHNDSIESVLDYQVPPEKFSELAAFDGSVIVERTAGEVSARCHDIEANRLALNLMHDIVTGAKAAAAAREYYAKEFTDYRRKKPTPYMRKLHFTATLADTRDPDERVISDEELEQAMKEGEENG
jgi:hypothetical protein